MLEKSLKFKQRYDELTELIMKPEIIADNKEWKKLVKERSGLEELVEVRNQLEKVVNDLNANEKSLENLWMFAWWQYKQISTNNQYLYI